MKKILILLIFIPFMGNAQNYRVVNTDFSPYSNSYWEFNAGIYTEEYFTFPGASFLWGKTHYYKNNTFFDYQFGLAFPTIFTGKAGFGIGNEDRPFGLSLGLRPFPSTIYLQLHFKSKLVFSIEPLIAHDYFGQTEYNRGISIVTIGYRF